MYPFILELEYLKIKNKRSLQQVNDLIATIQKFTIQPHETC